jgi:hypothetical protein
VVEAGINGTDHNSVSLLISYMEQMCQGFVSILVPTCRPNASCLIADMFVNSNWLLMPVTVAERSKA